MKNYIGGFQALLIAMIFASCSIFNGNTETKDTAEPNASVSEATDQLNEEEDDETAQAQTSNVPEMIIGSAILDRMVSKLASALTLDENQVNKFRTIATNAFVNSGKDLQAEYPVKDLKTITDGILKSEQSSISEILNSTQNDKFLKFINK